MYLKSSSLIDFSRLNRDDLVNLQNKLQYSNFISINHFCVKFDLNYNQALNFAFRFKEYENTLIKRVSRNRSKEKRIYSYIYFNTYLFEYIYNRKQKIKRELQTLFYLFDDCRIETDNKINRGMFIRAFSQAIGGSFTSYYNYLSNDIFYLGVNTILDLKNSFLGEKLYKHYEILPIIALDYALERTKNKEEIFYKVLNSKAFRSLLDFKALEEYLQSEHVNELNIDKDIIYKFIYKLELQSIKSIKSKVACL